MTPSFHRPRRTGAAADRRRLDFRPQPLEPRTLLADAGALLADINPTTDMLDPRNLLSVGDVAYFAGRAAAGDGSELWRTDGTAAGTVRVKDINPGLPGSDPQRFAAVGNTVFFAATDPAGGQELWKTDGTEVGTVRVKDIRPGPANSAPNHLTAVGNTLYFAADNGTGVAQLWKSDGTESGTVRVKDAAGGVGEPSFLVDYNGVLLFAAGGGTAKDLWRSDGTDAGTALVARTASLGSSNVLHLTRMGDAVYFSADLGGINGRGDLFRTDGTPEGTRRVKQIDYGSLDTSSLNSFAASGDRLYFVAGDRNSGAYDLWRSDGTEAGTVRLLAGYALPSGTRFTPVGERSVVFGLRTAAHGAEPWVSDGTPGGTRLITELAPGPADGMFPPVGGVRMGDFVYFSPNVDFNRPQLWRTNGTAAGTSLVADVPDAGQFVALLGTAGAAGDVLLFSGGRYIGDGDLYRTDGTAGGTFRVGAASPPAGTNSSMTDLTAQNDQSPGVFRAGPYVYFEANDGVHGDELWRVAANAPGAAPEMVADLAPGGVSSDPASFAVADDGTFYFTAVTPAAGREVYRIAPGAGATPQPLPQVRPGPASSSAWRLSAAGNFLFFSARGSDLDPWEAWRYDPASGRITRAYADATPRSPSALVRAGDYWFFGAYIANANTPSLFRVDAAGTVVHVADIPGGVSGPDPWLFTAVGSVVYFRGETPDFRQELWKSDGTRAGTVRVSDFGSTTNEDQVRDMAALGGALYVARESGSPAGRGVWRSDGTAAGTVRVADVADPSDLAVASGRLFVASADGLHAIDPPGPPGGPVTATRVLAPESESHFIAAALHPAGGDVYAVGFGSTSGVRDRFELWKVEGDATSAAGSRRVRVVSPWVRGSLLGNYWQVGRYALASDEDYLYFPAWTPEHGMEPHRLPLAGVPPAGAVVGRHVFYNNSAFDGGDPAPDARDDGAVATDKSALLPGQAATYANTTNFARGINGIMIDVSGGAPLTALALAADALGLHTSPGGPGAAWSPAPRPSQIAIRPGAGTGGSDRITLVWPDGAIRNTWLRVTVQAPPEFGLPQDVFTFGNLVGETGDPDNPARVNALDLAAVKRALTTTSVPLTTPADINKDGRMNALDVAAVKANLTRALQPLVSVMATPMVVPPDATQSAAVRRVWEDPDAVTLW